MLKDFLIDLFFPKFCLSCQKEGDWVCEDCKTFLNILEHQYCLCDIPKRMPFARKCKNCQYKTLSGLYCALNYKENYISKNLILKLKYPPFIKTLNKTLADLIASHIYLSETNPKDVFLDSVLIPIPLYKKKMKYRGFNQTFEIAKEISQRFKVKMEINNLVKIKETLSQTNLTKEQRERNIQNSFFCNSPEKIKNKKVFLVDDVYTTGSTMEEAAKILKESGAEGVWGIVVAREA